jgi:hypothetical protein
VTFAAIVLVFVWIGRTIWAHPGERTAGTEIALRLAATLIGGPVLIARLLPPPVIEAAAERRIWLSNVLRWPLRNRRRTLRFALGFIFVGFAIGLVPSVWRNAPQWLAVIGVWCGVTGAAAAATAWTGFLLPRRYVVRLSPSTTTVLQPSQLVQHQRAEAAAGAVSIVCVLASLILQFLRLYNIGPW